jgi:spore maturation protein CgeB
MRSFEVPACGGIMLAEDSVEHRAFFEDGKEAFFFASPEEMVDQASRLLTISKVEANEVRMAARQRSVASGYSYRDRARAALAEIERIKRTA